MAVLDELPLIEVRVCVKGKALQEYHNKKVESQPGELGQYHAPNTVSTSYIESMTGEEFMIQMSVGPFYMFDCDALGFEVYIDGQKVRSTLLRRHEYFISSRWQLNIDGIKAEDVDASRRYTVQKFKFGNIETCKLFF
jgi:hypothetical protein